MANPKFQSMDLLRNIQVEDSMYAPFKTGGGHSDPDPNQATQIHEPSIPAVNYKTGNRIQIHTHRDVPEVDTTLLVPVMMGMLGLGAMRSYEKVNQVAREK